MEPKCGCIGTKIFSCENARKAARVATMSPRIANKVCNVRLLACKTRNLLIKTARAPQTNAHLGEETKGISLAAPSHKRIASDPGSDDSCTFYHTQPPSTPTPFVPTIFNRQQECPYVSSLLFALHSLIPMSCNAASFTACLAWSPHTRARSGRTIP
jgi:hypothetical protein